MGLPVVAAEEGPMRVRPADPEGEVVPQQGLAVNAIPAAGTAAPPCPSPIVTAKQTAAIAVAQRVGQTQPSRRRFPRGPPAAATNSGVRINVRRGATCGNAPSNAAVALSSCSSSGEDASSARCAATSGRNSVPMLIPSPLRWARRLSSPGRW
jgi:hypothetical protein